LAVTIDRRAGFINQSLIDTEPFQLAKATAPAQNANTPTLVVMSSKGACAILGSVADGAPRGLFHLPRPPFSGSGNSLATAIAR